MRLGVKCILCTLKMAIEHAQFMRIARFIWMFCTVLAVTGCASQAPKAPSYDDKTLRPINQDLVAWMARMNVDQAKSPAPSSQPAATSGPDNTRPLTYVGGAHANLMPSTTTTPAPMAGVSNSVKQVTPTSAKSVAPARLTTTSPGAPAALAKSNPAGAAEPPSASTPWTAPAGTSVLQALITWTRQGNWTLQWHASNDGPSLPRDIYVTGDMVAALRALIVATKPYGKQPYPVVIHASTRERAIVVCDRKRPLPKKPGKTATPTSNSFARNDLCAQVR